MERLLDALRTDDPPELSTVDVDRAIRAGRRIRARWTMGAVAALVIVLVAVPVAWFGSGGAPPPGAAQLAPDTGFDPLRRAITIADVPDVRPYGFTTGRNFQQLNLYSGFAQTTVTAYARGGKDVHYDVVVPPTGGTPAEPVNGRPAYWLDSRSGPMLAWQWADDAWTVAHVQLPGGQGDAGRDLLRRIAPAIRVDGNDAVSAPFTVSAPRPSYRLVGVYGIPPGNESAGVSLRFADQDPSGPNEDVGDPGTGVTVSVMRDDKTNLAASEQANRTVDGHPAWVNGRNLTILGFAGGFAIGVGGFADEEQAVEIARDVRLVPDPSDRSTWTTRPVRG